MIHYSLLTIHCSLLIILCCISSSLQAQTLGGEAAYSFLKLPSTPLLAAAGGVNVSYAATDIGLAMNNPALLNEGMHGQVGLSFNSFFAGVKAYALSGGYYAQKWQTTLGGSINFVDFGTIPQTDNAGYAQGVFHPTDYVVQVSAGKKYLQKWTYGLTLKGIHSSYGQYRSAALALDAGLLYSDSIRLFTIALLVKNAGFQIKTYHSSEDLPFDLQAGFTKKLTNAPFGFSITIQQLHRFDLSYADTAFNIENNITANHSFINKLFNHVVVSGHVYIGTNLEATVGYNYLRRSELNTGTSGAGLNGFSFGLRAMFRKLHLLYARSGYGRATAYNQFGVNINLSELAGLGTK